jgi:hypothetical protein
VLCWLINSVGVVAGVWRQSSASCWAHECIFRLKTLDNTVSETSCYKGKTGIMSKIVIVILIYNRHKHIFFVNPLLFANCIDIFSKWCKVTKI